MMHLMPSLNAPLQIQRVPEGKATRMRLRQSRLVVIPAKPQVEDRPACAHVHAQKHSQSSAYRITEGMRSRLISPSWRLHAPSQKWRLPLTVLFSHNT